MRHGQEGRDRDWLAGVFDQYGVLLRAFAIRRVGPDSADDIVSEVFAIAWRRRVEVPEPPLPWLYQTTRNVVLHHHRSRARLYVLTDAVVAGRRRAQELYESSLGDDLARPFPPSVEPCSTLS